MLNLEKIAMDGKLSDTVFKQLVSISHICKDDKNIEDCIASDELSDLIENKDYKSNTIKTYFQAILILIREYQQLSKYQDKYHELFQYYKEVANNYALEKELTEEIVSFTDIMNSVLSEFGEESQQYLLILLYDQLTMRNDFENISFDINDDKHIDLDKGTISIKNFNKTNKKYPPIVNHKLTDEFMQLLNKSLKMNPRPYLFKYKVQTLLKNMKLNINLLRHSKISTELQTTENKLDLNKKLDLASRMKHSSSTQIKYIRKLK